LAYQQHDAAPASPVVADPEPQTNRPRRRSVIAVAAAALLALAVVIPAIAAWPVASRSSYISRGYSSSHRAYDIAAPRGTRIVPTMSGRVVFAGWKSNCGGYQVWVSHGNGLYTAYYHMSKEVSWKGRAVRRQTSTLGYVGSTGCATGPHLHLEVWHGFPWRSGSYRVRPMNYIDSGTYLPYKYR
jgi:murein DD-endopeptidase MepM/ murein hydrolase activator NlpD